MKTAWSHLPNAAHINRVLASMKAHPEEWVAAYDAARGAARGAARKEAWDAAWDAALNAAYDASRAAARAAAMSAALNAARYAARAAARAAARDAIAALVAWDDCSQYLDMSSEKLEVWYHLTERPECLLLLPAVKAFEQINELELVDKNSVWQYNRYIA